MSDLLLTWFSIYGMPLMVVALVLGQMGIPLPTSILLLTVGAMLNDSVYSPALVFSFGLLGAALGDQLSYWIGRKGGPKVIERLRQSRYSHFIEKAEDYSNKWGATSVFLTRWLIPPVGPYLNYVVGLTKLRWASFTAMSLAGEAVWLAIFLAIGFVFRQSIEETNTLLANVAWFLGALILAVWLGRRFRRVWHAASEKRATSEK